jgi:Spy/CpxP family protein refolding chaperone
MKTVRAGLAGLAVAAAIVPTTMWAAGRLGYGEGSASMAGMLGGRAVSVLRLADKLGLSGDQVKRIIEIQADAAAANKPARELLRANRMAFRVSYDPAQYDAAMVSAYLAQQTPLLQQLATSSFQTRAKVLAILTPAQLKQFEQIRTSLREKWQARHWES